MPLTLKISCKKFGLEISGICGCVWHVLGSFVWFLDGFVWFWLVLVTCGWFWLVVDDFYLAVGSFGPFWLALAGFIWLHVL